MYINGVRHTATSYLKPLHINKGKTIAQTISERINYIINPNKTNKGKLVTGYECDPLVADVQFLLLKKQYLNITGRNQDNENVIAYHIRQAFKPGEITPEEANRIGYELAMSFTKGKHQFIVATHIDKLHIHNHIIFNSTTLDCTQKFRNFCGSYKTLRLLSDQICIEHGLSIIDNPKQHNSNYGTWLGDKKKLSWQEKLRQAIDTVLETNPPDMRAFIQAMKAAGYEVKEGKRISFRAPGQRRFTTLRSLKDDYTDDAILERIMGTRIVVPKQKTVAIGNNQKMNLLIDIQNSIKAKNSPGYEKWAKVFNLKQAAQTLIFLQENNLTEYERLEEKTAEATNIFNSISIQIKEKEMRLNEISMLQKHISNYSRTRDVYMDYRKSGYSKKFLAEHEGNIILHQAAKKAFNNLGLKKIPTIKSLQIEYAALLSEKKKLYQSYHKAKDDMQKLAVVKSNTDRLLNYNSLEKTMEEKGQLR